MGIPKQENIAKGLGVENLNAAQAERLNRITVKLHEQGFDGLSISQIARGCRGGNTKQVLDKYEAKIEYLSNGNAKKEAEESLKARNNGDNVTDEQVKTEMRERLVLKSVYDVKSEREVSEMRATEIGTLKSESLIQEARITAERNREKLNDSDYMASVKDNLHTHLYAQGRSNGGAQKDAEKIMNVIEQFSKK